MQLINAANTSQLLTRVNTDITFTEIRLIPQSTQAKAILIIAELAGAKWIPNAVVMIPGNAATCTANATQAARKRIKPMLNPRKGPKVALT
ncbi:hypothetical protein D3C87_1540140 [compost metagenome]